MMRAWLLLVTVTMFGGGCGMFAKMQQSVFFSKFRLDKSVDATAYKGIAKPGTRALGEALEEAPVTPAVELALAEWT